eukprot:2658249-Amphidinium_carterae.4
MAMTYSRGSFRKYLCDSFSKHKPALGSGGANAWATTASRMDDACSGCLFMKSHTSTIAACCLRACSALALDEIDSTN